MKVEIKNEILSNHTCGFCSVGNHTRCPGGVLNGNGVDVVVCGCTCRSLEAKHRCLHCNSRENVNPKTWNCEDVEGCVIAVETRILKERKRLYAHRSDEKTAKAQKANRELKPKLKPRECYCGCDGQTKGGLFLPGHDSRLLSKTVKDITSGSSDLKSVLNEWESAGVSPALRSKLERRVNK